MAHYLLILLISFTLLFSSCSQDRQDEPLLKYSNISLKNNKIKILAIGNSFSQDATEQYLYELFKEAGYEAVIGNMFIAGCTLDKHWENIQDNNKDYIYYKINNGKLKEKSKYSLAQAISDEDWNIITLQQGSVKAADSSSYYPYISDIINWISQHSDASVYLHLTWAYENEFIEKNYSGYFGNQSNMYETTKETVKKIWQDNTEIVDIIPSGTAIQNGRTTYIGDNFNRDCIHLETTYGRFTAACTWFEKLTGYPAIFNFYNPGFDFDKVMIAKFAAHNAVGNPFSVTDMSGF